jgi:hypothetical protein
MSGCDDDRLKSCIIAASASVWNVHEMYPAQLDAVYRLLHPLRPNHLAVIQQTGAGKTHILRTLGVIKRGTILIFIPLLTLSADVMSKFTCANQKFGAFAVQHLDELFDANIVDVRYQNVGFVFHHLIDHIVYAFGNFVVVIGSFSFPANTDSTIKM